MQVQVCMQVQVSPNSRPGTQPGSLGAVIQYLKSASARRINALRRSPGAPVWQRNYYEHILRDEEELESVRRYIHENPRRWLEDEENK